MIVSKNKNCILLHYNEELPQYKKLKVVPNEIIREIIITEKQNNKNKREYKRVWTRGYYKNIIIDNVKMRKWIRGYWRKFYPDKIFKELKKTK
jgi:hypothetical protein